MPFISILNWMLLNTTSIILINMFLYPSICKAEKTKSQSNLSKVLIHFTDTLIMSRLLKVLLKYLKLFFFVLATEWLSSIIVSNICCNRFLSSMWVCILQYFFITIFIYDIFKYFFWIDSYSGSSNHGASPSPRVINI